jgi:hypothetical protein
MPGRPTASELHEARSTYDQMARVRDDQGWIVSSRARFDAHATPRLVAAALALRRGEFDGNAHAAATTMGHSISKPSQVTNYMSKIERLVKVQQATAEVQQATALSKQTACSMQLLSSANVLSGSLAAVTLLASTHHEAGSAAGPSAHRGIQMANLIDRSATGSIFPAAACTQPALSTSSAAATPSRSAHAAQPALSTSSAAATPSRSAHAALSLDTSSLQPSSSQPSSSQFDPQWRIEPSWVSRHQPELTHLNVGPVLGTPQGRHAKRRLEGQAVTPDGGVQTQVEYAHYTLPPGDGESKTGAERRYDRHQKREKDAILRMELSGWQVAGSTASPLESSVQTRAENGTLKTNVCFPGDLVWLTSEPTASYTQPVGMVSAPLQLAQIQKCYVNGAANVLLMDEVSLSPDPAKPLRVSRPMTVLDAAQRFLSPLAERPRFVGERVRLCHKSACRGSFCKHDLDKWVADGASRKSLPGSFSYQPLPSGSQPHYHRLRGLGRPRLFDRGRTAAPGLSGSLTGESELAMIRKINLNDVILTSPGPFALDDRPRLHPQPLLHPQPHLHLHPHLSISHLTLTLTSAFTLTLT